MGSPHDRKSTFDAAHHGHDAVLPAIDAHVARGHAHHTDAPGGIGTNGVGEIHVLADLLGTAIAQPARDMTRREIVLEARHRMALVVALNPAIGRDRKREVGGRRLGVEAGNDLHTRIPGGGNERRNDRAQSGRDRCHAAFRRNHESGASPGGCTDLARIGFGHREIGGHGLRPPGIRYGRLIDDSRHPQHVGLRAREPHDAEHQIGRADRQPEADCGRVPFEPQRHGEGIGEEADQERDGVHPQERCALDQDGSRHRAVGQRPVGAVRGLQFKQELEGRPASRKREQRE